MKIRLTDARNFIDRDGEKISDALKRVNGKADEHTFEYPVELDRVNLAAIKKYESLGLPKSHHKGASYIATSGEPVPSGYKYSRIATRVRVECFATGWFITSIERCDIYPNEGGGIELVLTQDQNDYLVGKLQDQYTIQEQAL